MKIFKFLLLTFLAVFVSALWWGHPGDTVGKTESTLRRSCNQMGGRTLLYKNAGQQTVVDDDCQKLKVFKKTSDLVSEFRGFKEKVCTGVFAQSGHLPFSLLLAGMSFRL